MHAYVHYTHYATHLVAKGMDSLCLIATGDASIGMALGKRIMMART